ncbi:MAG TPA: hypothetical protein VEP90_04270 [Methylomirabilota bacterium]|nr:hypothetical protein [Methylomirabilota bacterium]
MNRIKEIFEVEPRPFDGLYELVDNFLEETDHITILEPDPTKALDLLGEIDDIVYHRLRPAIWDRMEELRKHEREKDNR